MAQQVYKQVQVLSVQYLTYLMTNQWKRQEEKKKKGERKREREQESKGSK